MKLMRPLVFAAFLCFASAGCQSSKAHPPMLGAKELLAPNVGEQVTVEGTARYNSVWGPSVVGSDFELPVFAEKPWGAELNGKPVQVIGKLNSRKKFDEPPQRDVGDYWLNHATWSLQPADKK